MATSWEHRSANGFRWTCRTSARDELEDSLFSHCGDLGERVPVARIRRGRSFYALRSDGGDLFVKRFASPHYDATLAYRILTGRVRGRREFRNAVEAHARSAPVPEPLAFGALHRPFRSYESLLVYRHLPRDARPLAEAKLEAETSAIRARLGRAFSGVVAEMHEAGVYHLDLTPLNVLLGGDPSGEFALFAVDLETIRFGSPDDAALSRRCLARIDERFEWPSGEERRRFVADYLAARQALREAR